jgi:hypothetical protein
MRPAHCRRGYFFLLDKKEAKNQGFIKLAKIWCDGWA